MPAATKAKKTTSGPSGPRPATFDHLQKKKPLEKTVHIYLDDDAIAAHTAALEALERAKRIDLSRTGRDLPEVLEAQSLLTGLEEALAKARAALDNETVTLRFRSIGRKRYDKLVHEYPTDEKQDAEHKDEHGVPAPYDAEEFSVALIAASCVEPVLSEDQVRELRDTWNVSEYVEMFMAALEVNTQRRVADLGNASG